MTGGDLTTAAAPTESASRWGPFSHLAFTVIWTASLVSNVGTAMFDTASGWLITSLDANPITVSLVQVAVSLPLFLFTLPSGALADVIDSRRLLIAVEVAILAVSMVFAGLVSLKLATPSLLLATTFLLGVGGALTSPAWGATIPMLVPKQDLDSATAANGVAFNIGRAAGPALGGLVIAASGIAIPFWAFAASNVGIIAALIWWRSPRKGAHGLPAERLASAIRAGVRHAANNPDLGATLVRVLAFFPFASAYLALLPLLARHLMSEGPQLYGILLAAIGVGTVGGSLIIRWLKDELGPDRLVAAGSLAAAFALVLFARPHHGGLSVPARRRFMDPCADEALCIGAGRTAGLGARPRARGIPDFHLRSDDRRQRGVGETLRHGRPADYLFRGRGGAGSRHSDDLAMEASDRGRN
jgi:MFS family permease